MKGSPAVENGYLPTLLMVEDSDEDFVAAERALRRVLFDYPIHRCADGEEALDYLRSRPEEALPGLVLLDLNLPGTDGRAVLREIKENPKLRKLPVVVFTTSSDERDIQQCYQEGANSYIQKPVNFEELHASLKRLKDYWFEVVILPTETHP